MTRHSMLSFPFVRFVLCALCVATATRADVKPHAGMLRYPDVSATHIVFCYANDLWIAPRDGGLASPLASPPGMETFPRFAPDGQAIAFVGNYDGNRDLYTVPLAGGIPHRVTFHPGAETLCDWTPKSFDSAASHLIYFTGGSFEYPRAVELFTVDVGGGIPKKLPVPYGANAAISPDGQWLAYTPHSHDHRTWKRYRGGMATDIWLFNLKDHQSKKITDWEGTDSQPMWSPDGSRVYYMSDAGPEHRVNIWFYDLASGKREQVTTFKEYDVKWPAMGPGSSGKGEVVMQVGPDLVLLDCTTGKTRIVEITIPGDRPKLKPHTVNQSNLIAAYELSPTGKRAVMEARGDIWTIPAEHGSPRNLTRTSGVAERDPSWSPDGKWISYFSDASGEYELYLVQSDGKSDPKKVTSSTGESSVPAMCWKGGPYWSPDSRMLLFSDKRGSIYLHTVESGQTRLIDTEPWANFGRPSWSGDSQWIAYTRTGENQRPSVWLYNVPAAKLHQVTSGMFGDGWPTFDRAGEYLYFTSNRHFNSPIYEDVGTTFVYADTDLLFVVPLKKSARSPFAPRTDEEAWKKDDEKKSDASASQPATATAASSATTAASTPSSDEAKKDDKKPVEIDIDGFEQRAIQIPVRRGGFYNLCVNDEGKLIYIRQPARGAEAGPSVRIFDLKDDKREEKTVIDGVGDLRISADGKKLLLRGDGFSVVDAREGQKMDKRLPMDLLASIQPRDEWRQLFNDAWRIERDFFYDPTMHGVDWSAVRDQYAKMLDDCASREDVAYVISEMISELNVGHAYYGGGDLEWQPSTSVGMLGCDFELLPADGDAPAVFRIARILEGGAWDYDARGPLSQPGMDVKAGDFLLAVNGVPLDTSRSPLAAFQGLADRVVTLTIARERPHGSMPAILANATTGPADGAAWDGKPRDIVVQTLSSDYDLRYRAWIEKNRNYVEQKSGGKVGYIYVPDTGINGQNNLFRQFYGQIDKQALIIDERWNGGGQIPTRFIELLNRPVTNYWARRDGRDWMWPPDSHQGHRCMLINGLAGSGGDMFPWLFKFNKLGPVIGMRTWGGLVGISGNPGLIDGASVTAPTFAFYENDGTWGVEGHGIDPDVPVLDDPALMVNGGDPQLDKAIELMNEAVRTKPYVPPKRPPYPNRKGMGIPDADK